MRNYEFIFNIRNSQIDISRGLKSYDEKDNTKVDKVDGKELSTNDFTNEHKSKLEGIDLNRHYTKDEVYNKEETYTKDEVYNKEETYTKDEINNELSKKAEKVHTHSQYLTEHQSLEGYATEEYVDNLTPIKIFPIIKTASNAIIKLNEVTTNGAYMLPKRENGIGWENMVKSPLNYNGGKYKLLPQILPLIPNDINIFVDLFCGGLNVGINVKANKIVANDRLEPLMNIFKGMKENGSKESLKMVETQIEKYHLNKTNREGFNEIRAYYNSGHKDWDIFYSMVVHAYNYQMEFNKSGGYNVPLGTNRSWFNPTLKKNFIKFTEELDKKDIEFSNIDFRKFDIESLNENDFVYLDPPYLIGYASYNKQKAWTEQDDKDLFDFCDKLNSKGIRFAMSNVFKNKGLENKQLINWSKKYKVHYLGVNYKNCSHQRYDRVSETVEVLITNY